jgi:peptidoglycan/LPS O-acetylase OafA/YrhL
MHLPSRPENRVVLLAALLFLIACALPAIDLPHDSPDDMIRGPQLGITAFLLGGFGLGLSLLSLMENPGLHSVLVLMFSASWVANPSLLVGCVLLRRKKYKGAIIAGMIALVLGCWYLINAWNLGPVPTRALPLVGAYFWLGSMVVLTTGATVMRAGAAGR